MPFCPQCRDEFREGFTTCADCGTTLVDVLPAEGAPEAPEEGEGSHGGWDAVFESGKLYEAELMAMRIQDAGIEAQVVDRTFTEAPMPDVSNFNTVQVLVPTDRADEARQIVAQPVELEEGADVPGTEPETPVDSGSEEQ
jgi:hypothetical protein